MTTRREIYRGDIIDAEIIEDVPDPHATSRAEYEGLIEGAIIGFDDNQSKVISDRLMHVKARKGTRHWETKDRVPKGSDDPKCHYCKEPADYRLRFAEYHGMMEVCEAHLEKGKEAAYHVTPNGERSEDNLHQVIKISKAPSSDDFLKYGQKAVPSTDSFVRELDSDYAVETDRWVQDMEDTMERVIMRMIRREMNQAAADMERAGVIGLYQRTEKGRPLVRLMGSEHHVNLKRQEIFDGAMEIVRNAVRRQSDRVAKRITDADRSGESMSVIQAEVRTLIGARGKWRKALATNIATQVIERSKNAVYGELDGVYSKVWHAHHDERTRPTHLRADGQVKQGREKFHVGMAYLDHPCDPSGPPEETINCRCFLTWRINSELPNAFTA